MRRESKEEEKEISKEGEIDRKENEEREGERNT